VQDSGTWDAALLNGKMFSSTSPDLKRMTIAHKNL
jgi:hypothetical protein